MTLASMTGDETTAVATLEAAGWRCELYPSINEMRLHGPVSNDISSYVGMTRSGAGHLTLTQRYKPNLSAPLRAAIAVLIQAVEDGG